MADRENHQRWINCIYFHLSSNFITVFHSYLDLNDSHSDSIFYMGGGAPLKPKLRDPLLGISPQVASLYNLELHDKHLLST